MTFARVDGIPVPGRSALSRKFYVLIFKSSRWLYFKNLFDGEFISAF